MYYFTYGDFDSRDLKGIRVRKVDSLSIPKRSIQSLPVQGRDGNLIIDNGSYENRLIKIEIQIITSSTKQINHIAEELAYFFQYDMDYKPLTLSEDPTVYFEGICTNNIDIGRTIKTIGSAQLIFEAKPYKRMLDGDKKISLIANSAIFNPTRYDSRPWIKIIGDGDIELLIGSQKVMLKGVSTSIIIDSDSMECIGPNGNSENDKMYSKYPTLTYGENKISKQSGNVSKIEIVPRWRKI